MSRTWTMKSHGIFIYYSLPDFLILPIIEFSCLGHVGIFMMLMLDKESAWNARDAGDEDSILGSGRSSWRRAWQPTSVFLPREPLGQRSLVCYSPQGHTELDTTEVTERVHAHVCASRGGRPWVAIACWSHSNSPLLEKYLSVSFGSIKPQQPTERWRWTWNRCHVCGQWQEVFSLLSSPGERIWRCRLYPTSDSDSNSDVKGVFSTTKLFSNISWEAYNSG